MNRSGFSGIGGVCLHVLTMSTIAVVEVLWKAPQGAIKRNLVVASDRLIGQVETSASGSVLISTPTGYGKTLVYLPLPVAK